LRNLIGQARRMPERGKSGYATVSTPFLRPRRPNGKHATLGHPFAPAGFRRSHVDFVAFLQQFAENASSGLKHG
jgi:hypothetical protein